MTKNQVIETIKKEKLIVIVRGVEEKDLLSLCQAMYEGGVRLVELTFDMKGCVPPAQTAKQIAMLSEAFTGRITVGAGTVVTEEQARAALAGGAKYLISPNTDGKIISFANENDLVSIPGAMTPSEIVGAYTMGADFVKIFPSDALGLSYIKAVRAPLSHIPMLAVGGVDEKNVGDFLKTGVCGVGVGSSIVKHALIENGDFAAIAALARAYTDAIRRAE